MKKSSYSILMFVLALVAIFLATQARAAEDVQGRGVLKAMGSGLAVVKGTMKMRVAGNGFLLIDPGDNVCPLGIDINGHGEKVELGDGRILYVGFRGLARIEGCEINVKMAGARVDLLAVGSGRAVLEGCGRFHTRRFNGPWHMPGEIVFGKPAQAAPTVNEESEAKADLLVDNPFFDLLEDIQ